jgi:hypothetical protein
MAPSRFTKTKWETTLVEYKANTARPTCEEWRVITAAAWAKSSRVRQVANDDPDTSILQQYRGQIYIPKPKPVA